MNGLFHPAAWVHLDWILVLVVVWFLIGLLGVFALRRFRFVATVLFPLSALFSLLLMGLALSAVGGSPEVAVLPIGWPRSPLSLRCLALAPRPVFCRCTSGCPKRIRRHPLRCRP